MASDGSTGFRHWIILSILLGEDGSGWVVPDGIGDGTTGVRVVYEKPDEEEVLASAQLLFSGLSFLRIARKGVLNGGRLMIAECRHHRTNSDLLELNHFRFLKRAREGEREETRGVVLSAVRPFFAADERAAG